MYPDLPVYVLLHLLYHSRGRKRVGTKGAGTEGGGDAGSSGASERSPPTFGPLAPKSVNAHSPGSSAFSYVARERVPKSENLTLKQCRYLIRSPSLKCINHLWVVVQTPTPVQAPVQDFVMRLVVISAESPFVGNCCSSLCLSYLGILRSTGPTL